MSAAYKLFNELPIYSKQHCFSEENWEESVQGRPLFSAMASCGLFGISEDHIEKYLSLDERFLKNKSSTFFFRADGDSMWPLIYPGDYLIVDRSVEVVSGKVVVACVGGEFLCKRYLTRQNKHFLASENVQYPAIEIEEGRDVTVFGAVTGIVREI